MEIKVKRICENCTEIFYVIPSRMKHGRGKHCSPACQYESRRKQPKNGEIRNCLNCQKSFYITPNKVKDIKRGVGKYCSRKCRDEHWIGENNPQYIDGNRRNYHGPNWYSQRRKALKRDDCICQRCWITQEESRIKFGQTLVVHHIIPFRMFEGDYITGNQLWNLVTLCHSCHKTVEKYVKKMRPS